MNRPDAAIRSVPLLFDLAVEQAGEILLRVGAIGRDVGRSDVYHHNKILCEMKRFALFTRLGAA